MDKKLYMVEVTYQGSMDIPVAATSENEAETIADMAASMADCDIDSSFWTRELTNKPSYGLQNEQVEGLKGTITGKNCLEVWEELNREKVLREKEESWPKLPGFELAEIAG